jgi:hypothetical protein
MADLTRRIDYEPWNLMIELLQPMCAVVPVM